MWKFAEKATKVWGLKQWEGIKDPNKDILFFGMYSENDYEVFRHFEGNKSVYWGGSDILQMLRSNERKRVMKLHSKNTKHYVDTEQEGDELKSLGLDVWVSPAFFEDVNDFPICYKHSDTPHIYLSGHPNREEEYGFNLCKEIAKEEPELNFHFYGVEGQNTKNITYHGWVENEQFNKEIKNYQCGLRPNIHDGCSEIIVKAILQGQYPIAFLPYPVGVWNYQTKDELITLLKSLKTFLKPNLKARDYWLKNINNFPFLKK